MNNCRNNACQRPAQLFLCNDCTAVLANLLDRIPELLDELDDRIQKLDRVPHGTIGRNRPPANQLSIIDFDAVDIARKTRKALRGWVETVAERHTGRRPPGLDTIDTKMFARWLQVNVEAIARLDCAGDLYKYINELVGSGHKSGKLVKAVDRRERHFAGPCPTIVGYDNAGQPIECGHGLYAEVDEREVDCPECEQSIDVEQNRLKAERERDLMTATKLLEVLDNIGEPVDPDQLDRWISAERLRPRGYLHHGQVVKHRVRKDDPALYSCERARKLRRRDAQLARRKALAR
ncbi:DUF1922 domain-containing protein [Mycolicibacterium wolinskyi]|uniref:DUF1922 domain-containing protein n=1 Tax=Mycolicibacterium wolinskyi TaxID=59750 RepID=UPI0039179C8D